MRDEPDWAVRDSGCLSEHIALGWIVIPGSDRHLDVSKAASLRHELHFHLDREPVRRKREGLECPPREGAKTSLRVGDPGAHRSIRHGRHRPQPNTTDAWDATLQAVQEA